MGVVQTTYSQQGGGTMANINVTLNPDLLPNLFSDDGEGMKKLVELVLNQVLEAQMAEHLGADRHVVAPMKPDTVSPPDKSYGTLWGRAFSSPCEDGSRCNPQTTWAIPGTRHSHPEGRSIERNPA